jgi:hypothetical protein
VVRYLTENGGRATIEAIEQNADSCSPVTARKAVYSLARRDTIRRCNPGGQGVIAEYELARSPEVETTDA